MRIFFLLLACTSLLSGCDFGNTICPSVAEPAVVVEIRHAETEDPEAENAEGVLIDGNYTDSLRVKEETSEGIPVALAGGFERASTYTVRIDKSEAVWRISLDQSSQQKSAGQRLVKGTKPFTRPTQSDELSLSL